jgi:hypothetical protein
MLIHRQYCEQARECNISYEFYTILFKSSRKSQGLRNNMLSIVSMSQFSYYMFQKHCWLLQTSVVLQLRFAQTRVSAVVAVVVVVIVVVVVFVVVRF